MSDVLAGTDFSQYRNWQMVQTPSGGTYYQVPGTAFVYDPFTSQAKGKPVLFRNPKPTLDEQNRQRKLQERAASPQGQLLPVVGSVGGLVAGKYAIDALGAGGTAASGLSAGGSAAGAAMGGASGAGAAGGTAGAFLSGGSVPAAPVGISAVSGTAPGAPSLIGAGGATGASIAGQYVLPGVGAALGAYGLYDQLRKGDLSAGEGALMGAGTGASVGTMILPGVGTAIGAGVGLLGGLIGSMFNHKSTKQYQKERWGKLEKDGIIDAGIAKQLNHPEGDDQIWKDGKYAGEKWTMEKALDLVKDDPKHFFHVYGNYKTFGNDWSTYDDNQKAAIVSRLASEGLYKGSKGDVVIADEKKARQIKDEVLGISADPPAQPAPDSMSGRISQATDPGVTKMAQELARRADERNRR